MRAPAFSARVRSLGRESTLVGFGQLAAALGSLLALRLLTSRLSPAEFGQLALGLTVATFMQQTLYVPLAQGLLRFVGTAVASGRVTSFRSGVIPLAVVATVVAAASTIVAGTGLHLLGHADWPLLILASGAYAMLSGLEALCDAAQSSIRRRGVVAWHLTLSAALRTALAFAFVVLRPSSSSAMLGFAMGSGMALISQLVFLRHLGRAQLATSDEGDDVPLPAGEWKRRVLRYSTPLATWAVFSWAQIASDRWALQLFRSTSDVGRYAALYQVGFYPIMILSGVITQLVSPILFRSFGDGRDRAQFRRAARLNWTVVMVTAALTAVLTASAWCFHRFVFRLTVGPDFVSLSPLLPYVVLAAGLFACGLTASLWPLIQDKTRRLVLPKIATSLLGVVLTFLGAAVYGVSGVIASNVAFGLVYLVWMSAILRRARREADVEIESLGEA